MTGKGPVDGVIWVPLPARPPAFHQWERRVRTELRVAAHPAARLLRGHWQRLSPLALPRSVPLIRLSPALSPVASCSQLLPRMSVRSLPPARSKLRSEERRVGKEGVSTCRARGWPYQ